MVRLLCFATFYRLLYMNMLRIVFYRGKSEIDTITDGSSLVGCITLVSVTLSSPLANIFTIGEYDTQSCAIDGKSKVKYWRIEENGDITDNECEERDCGDGICKELETATCDCYGTGKDGVNCRSGISWLHNYTLYYIIWSY